MIEKIFKLAKEKDLKNVSIKIDNDFNLIACTLYAGKESQFVACNLKELLYIMTNQNK